MSSWTPPRRFTFSRPKAREIERGFGAPTQRLKDGGSRRVLRPGRASTVTVNSVWMSAAIGSAWETMMELRS